MRWIDRQLSPEEIDDYRLAERRASSKILDHDRRDLAAIYTEAQRERRERKLAADTMADRMEGARSRNGASVSRVNSRSWRWSAPRSPSDSVRDHGGLLDQSLSTSTSPRAPTASPSRGANRVLDVIGP